MVGVCRLLFGMWRVVVLASVWFVVSVCVFIARCSLVGGRWSLVFGIWTLFCFVVCWLVFGVLECVVCCSLLVGVSCVVCGLLFDVRCVLLVAC